MLKLFFTLYLSDKCINRMINFKFTLEKIALLLLISCFALACKDKESFEDRQRLLITAEAWQGERFEAKIEVVPAFVLALVGISASDLEFGENIPLLSVKFEANGTFSGSGLAGEPINGNWNLLDNGSKIQLQGFRFDIPDEFIPEALLALLPPEVEIADILPDTYDIVELNSDRLTLRSSGSSQLNIPVNGGTNISLTINPILDIFLVK